MNHHELEEGKVLRIDFKKLAKVSDCGEDLIPAVAQDCDTGEVLMLDTRTNLLWRPPCVNMATFWSTSRNELWIKGKTSGDYLEIVEVQISCEQNSVLYRVRPKGRGPVTPKGRGRQSGAITALSKRMAP